ncbi:MAG TPA: hypothetical protein VN626_08080 [Clostridia bacterium]|nr:hypothetical protein [Clostridia bacterium]
MAIKKDAVAADESAPKTTEKSNASKPAGNTGGFCVYLGPSIRGIIQSGSIFNGTKAQAADSLASAVEKYPLITSLIVTGETLAEDRIKIKTPDNLLYVNYNKLAAGQKK